MSEVKISEMEYKTLAADDYIPSVNPTANPTKNYYFLGGDIPLLVGMAIWNADTAYAAGMVVLYLDSVVKGTFLVVTTTSAGEAPVGAGYTKFSPLSLAWVNNTYSASDSDYSLAIGGARTGVVTYDDPIVSGTPYLIIFSGDFVNALTGSFRVVAVKGKVKDLMVEKFSNTQINVYFTADDNYAAGRLKFDFEYFGG